MEKGFKRNEMENRKGNVIFAAEQKHLKLNNESIQCTITLHLIELIIIQWLMFA